MTLLVIALFILVIVLDICIIMDIENVNKRIVGILKNEAEIDKNILDSINSLHNRVTELEKQC